MKEVRKNRSQEVKHLRVIARSVSDAAIRITEGQMSRGQDDMTPYNEMNLASQRLNDLASFKKVAFTLAEVLITLGIIGIVAAMTMPSLIQKHQEKVTVNRVKAAASIMAQAINLAIAENGDVSGWETEEVEDNRFVLSGDADKTTIYNLFKINVIINKLKLSKDCGYDKDGCFAENVKQLNGYNERDFNKIKRYYNVILSNGMSVSIEQYTEDLLRGEFWVDVNGLKQPNIVGRDIFLFYFEGAKVKAHANYEDCNKNNSNGYGCADWILSNGNMDYLKK